MHLCVASKFMDSPTALICMGKLSALFRTRVFPPGPRHLRDRNSVSKFCMAFIVYINTLNFAYIRRNSVCKFYNVGNFGKICAGVEFKSALLNRCGTLHIDFVGDRAFFFSMACPIPSQRNRNKIGGKDYDEWFCLRFTSSVDTVPCLPCGSFGLRQRTVFGGRFFHLFFNSPPLPLTFRRDDSDD